MKRAIETVDTFISIDVFRILRTLWRCGRTSPRNFMSGVILLAERVIKPGDVLDLDGRKISRGAGR